MGEHHAVDIDPTELKNAQKMWHGFTNLLKYSAILTAGVLALLALVFINW